MTILDEILDRKRGEVAEAKRRVTPEQMRAEAEASKEPIRGLATRLTAAAPPAIIAELKRRSPSKGLIREDFDPVALASAYAEGGAAALSVLTDEHFFGGELGYLSRVRAATTLPLLRKDFVIDPYQIDEARVAGADAVLLIVAALDPGELAQLHAQARSLGLDALVEVHDREELEVAVGAGATLLGVNNRDLRTFEVDLGVFESVAGHLGKDPNYVLVAESGIHHAKDVARLENAGATAFLVGESLMRRMDVAEALRELRRRQ
ncbi:MAG: indole-3-glycerol phosphate synthase TrpC [Myxococcota bacterium]|nr:indole-3-glycerol phosphate synthase TrpC [Myxococcota bacterium]